MSLYSLNLSSDIDRVVKALRSGPTDKPRDLIQHAIYYLPILKNPLNIRLVVLELIHSTALFPILPNNEGTQFDLEIASLVVEGFRSATHRKEAITDPTVSPNSWIENVLTALESVDYSNQWRSVAPLSGLLIAASSPDPKSLFPPPSQGLLRRVQNLLVSAVNNSMSSCSPGSNSSNAVILALSQTYSKLSPRFQTKLSTHQVLNRTIELAYYSPFGLDRGFILSPLRRLAGDQNPDTYLENKLQSPVLSNLNNLTQVIKRSIECSDINWELDGILNQFTTVSRFLSQEWLLTVKEIPSLEHNAGLWQLLKLSLFSFSISLEGFAFLLLHNNRPSFRSCAANFASKIIQLLSNLYFIVNHLSNAGFASYDFVFLTCMDVLLDPRNDVSLCNNLFRLLSGSCNIGAVQDNLLDRGKIIYLLNYSELLVYRADVETLGRALLIAREFFRPPDGSDLAYMQPVVESAHSVMLAALALTQDPIRGNQVSSKISSGVMPQYLTTVLSLFPGVLSPAQLNLAIQAVVQAVSPPSFVYEQDHELAAWVLEQIYVKCQQMTSGIAIPPQAQSSPLNNESEPGSEKSNIPPPTTRSVVVGTLINVLPFIDVRKLEQWLDRCWTVIQATRDNADLSVSPNSNLIRLETEYLEVELWRMISGELELQKAGIAINWWFRTHSHPHAQL